MIKPRHISVVMDGNGRWALNRLLPRIKGHAKGIETAKELIKLCLDHKIEILSLFAFSSENWNRPAAEVQAIMQLLVDSLNKEAQNLHKNQIKLTVIGEITRLPSQLIVAITDAMELTKNNQGLKLNIAINYGGKWDLVQAMQKLFAQLLQAKLQPTDLTAKMLAQYLSLGDLPDPDLFIRTSGEQRLSNFFLWQHAYTELFFTETLWPDFGEKDFIAALEFYSLRTRKFGEIKENMNA